MLSLRYSGKEYNNLSLINYSTAPFLARDGRFGGASHYQDVHRHPSLRGISVTLFFIKISQINLVIPKKSSTFADGYEKL